MNKQNSNNSSYWKYAFLAPTLFMTLLVLNPPYALQAQDSGLEVYNDGSDENDYENEFDDDLKPLLRAARQGDVNAVKRMLKTLTVPIALRVREQGNNTCV